MKEIMFFTYYLCDASNFCMLHVDKYYKTDRETKSLIFIDPGVYELRKKLEYTHIYRLRKLVNGRLGPNEYIAMDYPCDMLVEFEIPNFCGMRVFNLRYTEYARHLIYKTVKHHIRYADKDRYIFVVQSLYKDISDFKYRLKETLTISRDKGDRVIGFGNLCRILHPTPYTDAVFREIKRMVPPGTWIHFYGLGIRLIKKYLPQLADKFVVSVDSTKWTRTGTRKLREKYGDNCSTATRDLFFIDYMEKILKYFDSVHF